MISQLFFVFILSLIFLITYFISKNLKIPNIIFLSLFIWNLIFTLIYMFYVDKYGGDQLYYYFKHESLEEFYSTIKERKNIFRPGRNFINIITIFLKTKLFLSYESVVFIYSSLGLIGTLLLFSSWQIFIKNQNYSNYYIVLILIFLPSLTFWTSSIGKDPICFLAITLCIYSVISNKFRISLITLSIVLAFLVRPHISFVIYFSFLLSLCIHKSNFRFLYIFLFTIPLIIFYEFALSYSGFYLNIFSLTDINQYFGEVYNKNYKSDNIFLFSNKFLVLFFEPLFYNANNYFKIYVSIENLLIILFFCYLISKSKFNKINFTNYNTTLLFTSAIIITILLALTITSNVGIAVRQKWIVLPIIFSILLIFQSKNNEQ